MKSKQLLKRDCDPTRFTDDGETDFTVRTKTEPHKNHQNTRLSQTGCPKQHADIIPAPVNRCSEWNVVFKHSLTLDEFLEHRLIAINKLIQSETDDSVFPQIDCLIDLLSDPLPVWIANQQLYQSQSQMYVIRDPRNYYDESYADFREISNESGEYQILYNPYATFASVYVYSLDYMFAYKHIEKVAPYRLLDSRDEVCVDLNDYCNRGRVGNTQSIFFGNREEAIQVSLNINFDGTVDVCVVDHVHKDLAVSSYVTPFRPTEIRWSGKFLWNDWSNLGRSKYTIIDEPVFFLFPGWANKVDCGYDFKRGERRKKMSHYMLLTERFRLLLETTSHGIDAQLLLLDLEARTIELLTSFEEINLHVDADHRTLLVATHATMSPDMNTITCFYGDYETFKFRRITSL